MTCGVATNKWRRVSLWASGDFKLKMTNCLYEQWANFSDITVNYREKDRFLIGFRGLILAGGFCTSYTSISDLIRFFWAAYSDQHNPINIEQKFDPHQDYGRA